MFDSSYFCDANDEDFFQSVPESYSIDTKWKGIVASDIGDGVVFHDFRAEESDPTFSVGSSDVFLKTAFSGKRTVFDEPLSVQSDLADTPLGTSSSRFNVLSCSCNELENNIGGYLQNSLVFDFSFVASEHMWKGKHMEGSCCMEIEIRLSHEPSSSAITVAVAKIQADGLAPNGVSFSDFFNALRARFCNDPSYSEEPQKKPRRMMKALAFPLPSLSPQSVCDLDTAVQVDGVQTTDEEFLVGIEPVFKMAQEACFEPRLEAARMLCDLSTKAPHFLELPVFQAGCVSALSALVQDQFDQVRQHAIMAAAAFAEIPSYQEALIETKVLPVLFALVENCPGHALACDTAQIRRSAAYVLSLLCRSAPYQVRSRLQQQHLCDVDGWIEFTVPTITDARTKQHAEAAARILSNVQLTPADAAALSEELGSDLFHGALVH